MKNSIYNKVYIYNKVKSMAGIAMLLLSVRAMQKNSISTKYPCQFYFKSQYHPGTSLETALNGTGVYTMVSAKKVNGAWNIYSTLNDGKTRRKPSSSLQRRRIMPTILIWGGQRPKDAKKEWLHHGIIQFQRTCSLGPPMSKLSGTIWRNQLSAGMDRQPPIGNLRQM